MKILYSPTPCRIGETIRIPLMEVGEKAIALYLYLDQRFNPRDIWERRPDGLYIGNELRHYDSWFESARKYPKDFIEVVIIE